MANIRNALAIGGAMQGVGSGLHDLLGLLIERKLRREEEEKEQARAQGLLQLLQAFQPTKVPGAAGINRTMQAAGKMIPGMSAIQVPTEIPPEESAITEAISKARLKPADLPVIFQLMEGRRAERRATQEKEEERRFKRETAARELKGEEKLIHVRGKEERTTAAAKLGIERAGEEEEATGLEALLGIGPTPGVTGKGRLAAAKGALQLKEREVSGARPKIAPEDYPGNESFLRRHRGFLARQGIIYKNDVELREAAKNASEMEVARSLRSSSEIAQQPFRMEMRDAQNRFTLAIKRVDVLSRVGTDEEKIFADKMGSALAKMYTDTFAGDLSFTREAIDTRMGMLGEALKPYLPKGAQRDRALAALDDARAILIGKEPEAPPLNPLLRDYGVTERGWTDFYKSVIESGQSHTDAIHLMLDALRESGHAVPPGVEQTILFEETFGRPK